MKDIDIVLHNSITGCTIKHVSTGLSIAPCKPEKATSTDNRHLSHSGEHTITSQNTESASIELPFHENKIHSHQQTNIILRSWCIKPLCSSYKLGAEFRRHGQGIINHRHHSKSCWRCVCHVCTGYSDRSGIFSTNYVMEIEVKVA